MSLLDFLAYIDTRLETDRAIVIDQKVFDECFGPGLKLTRSIAHNTSFMVVEFRRSLYASVEAYLDAETREEGAVYIIVARDTLAYQKAVSELTTRVMKALGGQVTQTEVYPHKHEQGKPIQELQEPPRPEPEPAEEDAHGRQPRPDDDGNVGGGVLDLLASGEPYGIILCYL